MASGRNLDLLLRFTALDRLTSPLRNMSRGVTGARNAVAATTRELADLNRTQERIAKFKGLENRLTSQSAKLAETSAKTIKLKDALASTTQPTARMAAAVAAAEQREARLSTGLARETQRLSSLRRELTGAGIDTGRLADHERSLGTSIDGTNRRLAEQQRRLETIERRRARVDSARETGGKLQSAGGSATAAGAVIGAPLVIAGGKWREFESGMTDIAQKGEMSRKAARAMGGEIMRMAPRVNQLASDLRTGVDELAGFGMKPAEALAMMEPIGKTATAYKAQNEDLAKATFATYDNLKVPLGETAKTLDILAFAGKKGAFEVKDMAKHFPALTAAAQGLGQKGNGAVADLGAALQIVRKGAGDSDTAGNNLINLLAKINTEDTIKNFKDFGIDLPKAMKKAAKESKSPIEAITELTKQALKGDPSKLSFLFGDMQVQQAMRPLLANMAEYRAIRAGALQANGVVDADFTERLRDGAEKSRAFSIEMENLGLKVGSVTGPMLDNAKGKLAGMASWFSQLSESNPALFAGLVTVGGGLAGVLAIVGPLALAIGMMLPGLAMMKNGLGTLVPVLKFAGVAIRFVSIGLGRMALAVLTNPVLLLAAGIAVGAYLIYKNWSTVQGYLSAGLAWFQGLWARFNIFTVAGLGRLGGAILSFSPLGLFYRAFAGLMSWFGVSLPNTFAGFGAMIIGGLWRGITSRLAALKSGIIGIASSAAGWFKKAMGIHSPSRVFMGFGGFMTQGLALGVDRGARQPLDRVRRMASDIAAAGAPPRMLRNAVTIAGAVAAGAGVPSVASSAPARSSPAAPAAAARPTIVQHHQHDYHISIAGGGDVRSQARELLAEIERLQRVQRDRSYEDN
jgi:TP901 family phage tail tape measure protein